MDAPDRNQYVPSIPPDPKSLESAATRVRGALCAVSEVVDYRAAKGMVSGHGEIGPGINAMQHLHEALKLIETFDRLIEDAIYFDDPFLACRGRSQYGLLHFGRTQGGFTPFSDKRNHLFLPMDTARQLVGQPVGPTE